MDGSNLATIWEPPPMPLSAVDEMVNDLHALLEWPLPLNEGGDGVGVIGDDCMRGGVEGFGAGVVPNDGCSSWMDDLLLDPDLDVWTTPQMAHCGDAFGGDECVSMPGLTSDVSSSGGDETSVLDALEEMKASPETVEIETSTAEGEIAQKQGVSSPRTCGWGQDGPVESSISEKGCGNASSHSNSPNLTSCETLKAASPDTGSDSSEVGAGGTSCDNFNSQSKKSGTKIPDADDEDVKRQKRLDRNRESASQSRLRKKSYVKELEAKCRSMESHLSMLHQQVAYTSAQNNALREELAHVKCLKSNGSKSGAMEPAALPSDSLPSESLSRHTTQCLSVRRQLVAFLCHVLLLTHLLAAPQKLARSEGRTPSRPRSDRRSKTIASIGSRRSRKSTYQSRHRLPSSARRRKRSRRTSLRGSHSSLSRMSRNRKVHDVISTPNYHAYEGLVVYPSPKLSQYF